MVLTGAMAAGCGGGWWVSCERGEGSVDLMKSAFFVRWRFFRQFQSGVFSGAEFFPAVDNFR